MAFSAILVLAMVGHLLFCSLSKVLRASFFKVVLQAQSYRVIEINNNIVKLKIRERDKTMATRTLVIFYLSRLTNARSTLSLAIARTTTA